MYEKDKCEYRLGSSPSVEHIPYMAGDRGKILFGYTIVILKDSDIPKVEIMSHKEIMKIKARSKAKNDGPWVTDESEMMRKTVLRRAFKYIPKTQKLNQAMIADNNLYDLEAQHRAPGTSSGSDSLKERLNPTKEVENTVVEPDTVAPDPPQSSKPKNTGKSTQVQNEKPKETPADDFLPWQCNMCKKNFFVPKDDKCPLCFSADFTDTREK